MSLSLGERPTCDPKHVVERLCQIWCMYVFECTGSFLITSGIFIVIYLRYKYMVYELKLSGEHCTQL